MTSNSGYALLSTDEAMKVTADRYGFVSTDEVQSSPIDGKHRTKPSYISLSTNESQEQPVPWRLILLIYCVVGLDSIALVFQMPFLPTMCRDVFKLDEKLVGSAVGIINGGFNAANFLSSFYVGHLSDKYGRRPMILTGMIVSSITTSSFGFAKDFWTALANRLTVGFFDSNFAVAKAYLSDVAPPKHRNNVFAYYGAAFALSRCFASALAGLLTAIPFNVLPAFPYAIPCLIATAPLVVVTILCIFYLPESNPRLLNKAKPAALRSQMSLRDGLAAVMSDRVLLRLFVCNCIHNFANGGLLLALVIYPTMLRSTGGLGFNTVQVGVAYTWFGLVGFLYQVSCFDRLCRKIGLRRIYIGGLITFIATTASLCGASLPLWRYRDDNVVVPRLYRGASWAVLLLNYTFMSCAFMSGLPLLQSMLSNAAEPHIQGLTQGVAQSFASLVRAIGPMAAGVLFSVATALHAPSLVFVALAMSFALCLYIALGLPDSVSTPKELIHPLHTISTPPTSAPCSPYPPNTTPPFLPLPHPCDDDDDDPLSSPCATHTSPHCRRSASPWHDEQQDACSGASHLHYYDPPRAAFPAASTDLQRPQRVPEPRSTLGLPHPSSGNPFSDRDDSKGQSSPVAPLFTSLSAAVPPLPRPVSPRPPTPP